MSHLPGVIRVQENFAISITNDSANADFGTALARTDYSVEGDGVGICIADTGIRPTHEQFDDLGKIGGWFDAIAGASTPYDDHGHGTHAAGAWHRRCQRIHPPRCRSGRDVLCHQGSRQWGFSLADSVEQGLAWCVDQPGVDIISMSLGTPSGSDRLDSLSQAVNAAVDAGEIVVVSAGNEGDESEGLSEAASCSCCGAAGGGSLWFVVRRWGYARGSKGGLYEANHYRQSGRADQA